MPTSTHRAHIIASPVAHAHATHAAASPQLRRQAALFRLHREAQARDAHDMPPPHGQSEAPAESDAADAPADWSHDPQYDLPPPRFADAVASGDHARDGNENAGDGDTSDDASGDDASGDAGSGPAKASASGSAHASPQSSAPPALHAADMPTQAHMPQPATHAAVARTAPAGHISPALDDAATPHRLIDFIVSRVADFSSNPAVLARGHWHITIALDPALLPGCELSLTLSHFALTLRFDLSSEHSRYLILKHEPSLRERLDELMQSRSDGPHSIDIIVT
jgi:type III secretion control protein HpaP